MEDPFAVIARYLGASQRRPREIGCYVALGDSFTAGTGCAPGESWADRLAAALREVHPRLAYRNLAVEGATSVCGANDVLRSVRPDPDAYARRLAAILDRLRGVLPGVAILTATSPERWRFLELGPRTRRRVLRGLAAVNEATRLAAASRGVPCLDVTAHPGLDERENFSADGLHPSRVGHERAARELARAIGLHFGIDSAYGASER